MTTRRILLHFLAVASIASAILMPGMAFAQGTPTQYPYPKPLGTSGATPAGGGTKRSAPFQPAAYDQDSPIAWDAMIGGGYRSVSTTTERDNINAQWRKEGMLVWVAADGKTYRLGSDLVTWSQVADLGPGGLGSGTVTSVGVSMPSGFVVGNSPITTSGTISVGYTTQSANTFLRGPTSGGAATPTWGALVQADIPNGAIDLQRMADISTGTFLGRIAGTAGPPQALNSSQSTSMLNAMVGASSGAAGTKGLVPAPAAGDNTKFLRGDGTYATVGGSAVNMANTDLTLTGNRVHAGAGFDWELSGVNFLTLGGTNFELTGATYLTLGSPTELQISPPSVFASTAKLGQVLKLTDASLGRVEYGDPWTTKTPTFSSNINIDCGDGTSFIVKVNNVTSNFTINNPTNSRDGQIIKFRIKSDATGGWIPSWGSAFRFSGDMSGVPALLANKVLKVIAEYDGDAGKWDVVAANNGF